MNKVDVIIIGTGPGGVTAAIYLKRAGVSFKLFEKEMVGGKVNLTANIDNYPPIESIGGFDLASSYMKDLAYNDIEVSYEDVLEVTKENNEFIVKTNYGEYYSKTVLVASGTSDKTLGVKGEEKFLHKGISHCVVCDGNLFKGKPMAIVGGGNSALEECLYLMSLTDKIYLIHRRDEFRGNQTYLDKLKQSEKVEILTPYRIIECNGDQKLRKIIIENVNTFETKELEIEALFEYVGLIPNASFIKGFDIFDENGFIAVNIHQETRVEGLFACGDVTNKPLRQVIIASGDAALATHSILNYLRK